MGPPKAPDRYCLWRPGLIKGDFGLCRWDAEAAQQVMAAYEQRGNPVPIDVQHNSNPHCNPNLDRNNPPKGGGYAWLKLVETPAGPELWLDPIKWSDYAVQEIESGSRRAISPEWQFDPKTDRPTEITAISLVQNPGTHGIGLMASAQRPTANGEATMDMAMFVAALEAALTAEDPKTAIEALLAKVKEMAAPASEPEMGADMPEEQMGGGMAPEEKMAKAFAAAFKVSQKAPQAKGVTPDQVRREAVAAARTVFREEHQKAQLIASAKASPAWTDALGDELQALPVASVKRIVAALPRPATVITSATAAAAQQPEGGVKPQPLPGPAAEPQLTPSEQDAIKLIAGAGKTRDEHLKAAQASTGAKDGQFVFSAISQMSGRKVPAKASN